MVKLRARMRADEGATAVEYGIMVALIAVVIILAVFLLGQALNKTFEDVETCLSGQDEASCPAGEAGDDGEEE